MNRYKFLFKNIGLLTLSSFATKFISFFLIPLYTNILTTTEYGIYDLFNATIGVLLPILTLNIQDAVFRFSMGDEYDNKAIVTIASKLMLISNAIIIAGVIINYIFCFVPILKQYAAFFILMFLTQSLSGVITFYIRGLGLIKDLSISSVVASVITIVGNILFLAVFRLGLIGYFIANIVGPLYQCIFLAIRSHVMHDIELAKSFRKEKNEMLEYCKPLIANAIAWWVNNTSDRYIVIFFCGLAENGIYSVASKIPSILNLFQSIFSQAWSLSAVRDFDKDDKNDFFINTYKMYNCMLVIICSIIIIFDKVMAHFLYSKNFYMAWKYVPWLTIAIVFGALSGYLGGFFSAVKDSKIFARSSIAGAVTNIILNLLFTPFIGALGAAIATAICYFEVWFLRYYHSKKIITLKINLKRDIISYVLLVTQSVILIIIDNEIMLYGVQTFIFVLMMLLYMNDIIELIRKIQNFLSKKQGSSV